MATSSALPQTLNSITATKISELSKQRALFEQRLQETLQSARNATDTRFKTQILLEGVCRLRGYSRDAFDRDDIDEDIESDDEDASSWVPDRSERAVYANIRRFISQSRQDSSVSERILKGFVEKLENDLHFLERKHEHAFFYSGLVTEWLEHLEANADFGSESTSASSKSDYEQVGRAEMHEQRAQWESLVFTEADIDPVALRRYLDDLFTRTPLSKQALKELRERIKKFGTDLDTKQTHFTVNTLKWVANALFRSDLLSKEKTAVLKEFMRNPEVTQEVADVLNMRLAALDSWQWPAEGIPLEMRRQLNGKYRVFMDEELLDSLILQYLGTEWAVCFRSAFVSFLNSRAWIVRREDISQRDTERRQYFLDTIGSRTTHSCVNDERKETYKNDYFMTQLPATVHEGLRDYDDDDDDEPLGADRKNALETKHSLLHLLITESLVHQSLYGQFTTIRSDFKWFGPSLPHAAIHTVLEYFGVPENWLKFFKTFLQAPMKFTQDGPNAAIQVRRRGVPMSHTLSDCFGEILLFCMDCAVNVHTNGGYLYRLHDDFWYWGSEASCVRAWRAMMDFASVTGLEFNEEKTGTVRLGKGQGRTYGDSTEPRSDSTDEESTDSDSAIDANASDQLPAGEIRWGFLKLDSQQGRFIIDQDQVDAHISELQLQLDSCKSVFAWVQAWNSYFGRFFANNFGKPAMCFGREHIDIAIATLGRIERTLFANDSGTSQTSRQPSINGGANGVTNYLRRVLSERFNAHDLPEGFFYFPVELGGLELHNPYIPLLAMRENIKQTPQRRLQKAALKDEENYHADKERFEKHGSRRRFTDKFEIEPTGFLSLAEYMKYPETHSQPLLDAYRDLNQVPDEASLNLTAGFERYQQDLKGKGIGTVARGANGKGFSAGWTGMSPYWRWIAELYHGEMVEKYGSLAAVDREFMPLGVVKTLKEGKFRWQG